MAVMELDTPVLGATRFGFSPPTPEDPDAVTLHTVSREWTVDCRFEVSGDRLVPRNVRVSPAHGNSGPMTTEVLRAVHLGSLTRAMHGALVRLSHRGREFPDAGPEFTAMLSAMRSFTDPLPETPRRGRPRRGDDEHRRIALAYLELQAADPNHVMERLSDQEHAALGTVRDWISAAGDAGWLTKAATRGVRGREPGPRLLAEQQRSKRKASDR